MKVKEAFAIAGIGFGFLLVFHILWKEEFRHYIPQRPQQEIALNAAISEDFLNTNDKPFFLHYFSNDCRSARVNIQHIGKIMEDYKEDFNFYIINLSESTHEAFKRKHKLPDYVKVIDDPKKEIADRHQVASTPFASIVNQEGKMIFRGNYSNENGLCGPSDIKWSAPSVALKFIAQNNTPPALPSNHFRFSGCATN